jgi:glucose 1-dehydrogenase
MALGLDACAVKADVSCHDDTDRLFEVMNALPPAPLHLVNNAGVTSPPGSVEDLTPDRVARVFEINVFGAIEMARQSVIYMRANHGGHIVNVSSIAARIGSANEYVDYAASKGAIDTFTQGLADELVGEGIRVNALRPGVIDTEIHAKGGQPDRLDRIRHALPMGRAGTVNEIAKGILWLLSDEASYVTRSIMDISGGR